MNFYNVIPAYMYDNVSSLLFCDVTYFHYLQMMKAFRYVREKHKVAVHLMSSNSKDIVRITASSIAVFILIGILLSIVTYLLHFG